MIMCNINACAINTNYVRKEPYVTLPPKANAAFLPAVNTTSQPVNWSRTVSPVVYTTGELGASRDFPNFDLHL